MLKCNCGHLFKTSFKLYKYCRHIWPTTESYHECSALIFKQYEHRESPSFQGPVNVSWISVFNTHKKLSVTFENCFLGDCGFDCVVPCNLTGNAEGSFFLHLQQAWKKAMLHCFELNHCSPLQETNTAAPNSECTEPIAPRGLWWNLIKKFVGKLILTKHKGHADAAEAINWSWQWGKFICQHCVDLCLKLCSCWAGQPVSL